MSDSNSETLLQEMRSKAGTWRFTPISTVLGALGVFYASATRSPVVIAIGAAIALILVAIAWHVDQLRKTTVLMYDLEPEAVVDFERLVAALQELGQSQRIWHVDAAADVRDRKYHAGASTLVTRKETRVVNALPPYMKCNIDVPAVSVGRQRLYFFPDRVLVCEPHAVGAVPYADLRISRTTTRFVETDPVPSDARVVGQTWRYTNKSGGPDRRFRDNRQIPICEYEEVLFTSGSGLNELLQVSRLGAGERIEGFSHRSTLPAQAQFISPRWSALPPK
jgi:hypothetical protein